MPSEPTVGNSAGLFFVAFCFGALVTTAVTTTLIASPDAPPFTEPVPYPGLTIFSVSQVRQYQDVQGRHWWIFRYGSQTITIPANCKE